MICGLRHLYLTQPSVRLYLFGGYSLWTPVCLPLAGRSLHAGGASYVPVGSALHVPVPKDTFFVGHCCPDPEEDISRLHLSMGFGWSPRTLLSSMGDIIVLCHLCPLATPMFRLRGVLVGGPQIQATAWGLARDLMSSFCL